jgi:hypothetical protein
MMLDALIASAVALEEAVGDSFQLRVDVCNGYAERVRCTSLNQRVEPTAKSVLKGAGRADVPAEDEALLA